MARFDTSISLDHLHCYRQREVSGSEPYLWTAFFKIDGDTIVVDADSRGLFLNGPCTFIGTQGSHGNLGDTDVRTGDDVPIPAALGRLALTSKTFRTSAQLGAIETHERGAVGVVAALIEEESVTDGAANAGRVVFNREVEKGINAIIPTLPIDDPKVTPEAVAALTKKVMAAVKRAVIDNQGFWRNLGLLLVPLFDRDALISADVFYARDTEQIDARFRRIVSIPQRFPQPPLQLTTHDYGLFGQIHWTTESLHLVGVTGDGGVWHTIRHETAWDGFGDVKGQAGNHPGRFEAIASARVNDDLHVCGVTADGGVWHAIRRDNGGWVGFGDVKGQAGAHPGRFEAVACAAVNGELHVCGVTADGSVWHTIRHETAWDGFGDVKGQAGGHPGAFASVGCAAVNGELHVCGTTADGGMWHAVRRDRDWIGFGDVKGQAGVHPGRFEAVACAAVHGELHVCGVTADGGMWHTIRHETAWDGFGDVKGQAGNHPGRFEAVGCSAVNGELHVSGVTSDGGMWHAVRQDREWVGFGDVKGQAGSHPGSFVTTAAAGIG